MKIKHLKSNIKQHQTKSASCDGKVKTYLEPLHRRFVIVAIDKAVNNIALKVQSCKLYDPFDKNSKHWTFHIYNCSSF